MVYSLVTSDGHRVCYLLARDVLDYICDYGVRQQVVKDGQWFIQADCAP